ncbi:MAG: mycofactocin glycosyltransferase [Solirubrobacteraceae bacterium]|nr:mycofactocin glycosyltransferase [Solirubrobacteraceae bacterium]
MPTDVEASFDPAREEAELREYLGEAFEVERLWRYQQTLADEVVQVGDEQTLYRTSTAYLYNLTAFAMTGTKLPYLRELTAAVPPGARLLDYGCGIGSDGLLLVEAGYRVEFADFANPSTEYLRWRLARRGLEAPVHDIADHVPGGFDAAYAFDVIEHVEDPFAFLGELERRARLVEVNLLEEEPDDQEIHHELPIGALLRHAAKGRLRSYAVLHERSHLVLYEPGASGPVARAESLARLAAGRLTRARR